MKMLKVNLKVETGTKEAGVELTRRIVKYQKGFWSCYGGNPPAYTSYRYDIPDITDVTLGSMIADISSIRGMKSIAIDYKG